jgi:hypothetical protein
MHMWHLKGNQCAPACSQARAVQRGRRTGRGCSQLPGCLSLPRMHSTAAGSSAQPGPQSETGMPTCIPGLFTRAVRCTHGHTDVVVQMGTSVFCATNHPSILSAGPAAAPSHSRGQPAPSSALAAALAGRWVQVVAAQYTVHERSGQQLHPCRVLRHDSSKCRSRSHWLPQSEHGMERPSSMYRCRHVHHGMTLLLHLQEEGDQPRATASAPKLMQPMAGQLYRLEQAPLYKGYWNWYYSLFALHLVPTALGSYAHADASGRQRFGWAENRARSGTRQAAC